MSHFTTLRTRMVVAEHIAEAARDLGYNCTHGQVEIRGYQGARTEVEICIPTRNAGYDIGFRKAGESYEMIADWWGIRDINQTDFLNRMNQRYAYRATTAQLAEQGFSLVEEKRESDGRMHLVLRRFV